MPWAGSFAAATLAVIVATAACADSGTETTEPDDAPDGVAAAVVEVVDGDSLLTTIAGTEAEVRLLGINAPEAGECFGAEARSALDRLVGSGQVNLVVAGDADRDQFGRLLRYVYLGRTLVNRELIVDGFSLATAADHELRTDFRAAGETAWERRSGMWSPTACGESPPPAVHIRDVEFDPPGADLGGEWVEIGNDQGEAVTLTGWTIRDESSSNRYVLPPDFRLEATATVRIHTGCGSDSASDLHWCAEQPVWNNGGDTAILLSPEGNVADRMVYG